MEYVPSEQGQSGIFVHKYSSETAPSPKEIEDLEASLFASDVGKKIEHGKLFNSRSEEYGIFDETKPKIRANSGFLEAIVPNAKKFTKALDAVFKNPELLQGASL